MAAAVIIHAHHDAAKRNSAHHHSVVLEDDCAELGEDGEEPAPMTAHDISVAHEETLHREREESRLRKESSQSGGVSPAKSGTSASDPIRANTSETWATTATAADPRNKKYHVKADGVELGIYATWIREELDKEEACMELPFTMIMLVAFSIMATYHLQQDKVSIVENAIQMDITENANFAWAHAFGHKGIQDVNSYADFWSWTRLGLLPLITAPWSYSEGLDTAVSHGAGMPAYDVSALPSHRLFPGHLKAVPGRNDYLRYNKIIGGLRFRQDIAQASTDKCTFPGSPGTAAAFKDWFHKPCSPSLTGYLKPDLDQAGELEAPERIEWALMEDGNFDRVLTHIVDMEDGCTSATRQNRTCLCEWCAEQVPMQPWLNEETLRVELSFIVFNPTHGLFSYAGVNFWFNRAGHIYKLINVRSTWANILARPVFDIVMLVSGDAVWFLMVMYVVTNECKEVFKLIMSKDKPWYFTMAEDYLSFWNFIDWISILLAFLIVLRLMILVVGTGSSNEALGSLAELLTSGAAFERETVLKQVNSVYSTVAVTLENEEGFRFQLILYPMVLMLRLFKSFAAQPRLAVITSTFAQAGSDIFHFIIVFMSVYVCMTVNAVLFFGQDSQDFATFDRAFHSCFLIMFGDWDYDELEEIGRMKASLWFWMFMIIVVLVLQNIMLAILMEAYTCVKSESESSITLFAQINKQMRRWKQARSGERVRLNDIWDALREEMLSEGGSEEEMMTSVLKVYPDELLRKVNNIKQAQAVRTLTDSQRDYDEAHDAPHSVEDMAPTLKNLQGKTDNSLLCAAYLDTKFDVYEAIDKEADQQLKNEGHEGRAVKDALAAARREKVLQDAKVRFQNTVGTVKMHTRSRIDDLSSAIGGVLGDEMSSIEKRQKEQIKSMEQVEAAIQNMRSLSLKVSKTCTEVCEFSEVAFRESEDIILPDDSGIMGAALWPASSPFR